MNTPFAFRPHTFAVATLVLLSGCAGQQAMTEKKPPLPLESLGLSIAARSGGTPAAGPAQSSPTPAPVIIKATDARAPVTGDMLALPPGPSLLLRFTDAPLTAVVETILGDMLGQPHSVDASLQGLVSIDSGRELSPREAIRLLESVLTSNGAAMVRAADGTIAVVPSAELASRTLGLASPTAPGHAISVLPLRHIAPDVARALVEPLVKNGTVTADPRLRVLIVGGPGPERLAAAELLRGFDVDWMAGRSVGLFHLSQAAPAPVAREIQAILGDAGGQEEAGATRVLPLERMNAILVIAADPTQLDMAAGWVQRLDMGDSVTPRLHVFSLANADAAKVTRLLNRLFGGSSGNDSPVPAGRPAASLSTLTSGTAPGTGDSQTRLAAVAADAGGAAPREEVQPVGADGIRIAADPANNSVLVHASPRQAEIVGEAVRKLDVAPSQVLIEATIAEVTLNDALRYGVQSFLRGDGGDIQGGITRNSTTNSLRPVTQVPGFNLLLSRNGDPRLVLSALDEVTDVRVVSSPQVVVLDSQVAQLLVGDRVPILTRTAQSVDNPDAPIVSQVEYVNTGVMLRVVPRISQSGKVSMEVYQEISNVSSTRDSGNLTPTISQRQITSNVAIDNGQTVVLGGLISETQQQGRDGIPILSGLPGVGALFGERRNSSVRTELIVFITPRVIRDEREAEAVTAEMVSRLKAIQPPMR